MIPQRGWLARTVRWISGADRQATKIQEQAQAHAEQAAALLRAQAELDAQAERDRLAAQEEAERTAVAAREAQIASVRVAAESTEPLIHVAPATGGTFYVRREAWLAARESQARDVPLCDWRGDPVQPTPRKRIKTAIRRSTIEASILTPMKTIAVAEYQAPSQEQDGPSITM